MYFSLPLTTFTATSLFYGESEVSCVQVEAFFKLAMRCIRFPGQDTRTMIDVAKELKGLEDLSKTSTDSKHQPVTELPKPLIKYNNVLGKGKDILQCF